MKPGQKKREKGFCQDNDQMKDINQEIQNLLYIKSIVDQIAEKRNLNPNIIVVSQLRYDYWAERNLLKPNTDYFIAPIEVKPYISDFQG